MLHKCRACRSLTFELMHLKAKHLQTPSMVVVSFLMEASCFGGSDLCGFRRALRNGGIARAQCDGRKDWERPKSWERQGCFCFGGWC